MMDIIEQSFSLIRGVIRIERLIDGSDKYIGQMQESSRIKSKLIDFIRSYFGKE